MRPTPVCKEQLCLWICCDKLIPKWFCFASVSAMKCIMNIFCLKCHLWETDFNPVQVLGRFALSLWGCQTPAQYWTKIAHPWVHKFYPVLRLGSAGGLLRRFQTPVLYWTDFSLLVWTNNQQRTHKVKTFRRSYRAVSARPTPPSWTPSEPLPPDPILTWFGPDSDPKSPFFRSKSGPNQVRGRGSEGIQPGGVGLAGTAL